MDMKGKHSKKSLTLRNPDAAFWSGKRVFVTGHTGFKGAWLVIGLRELGAEVCGYSLAPESGPTLFEATGLASHCQHIVGNILDQRMLSEKMQAFRPDVVIHMAAQSLVRRSYETPTETFTTNVVGTAQVLEACRTISSLKVVLNVTTDKVYENEEKGTLFREKDALGGHDPYSASKACSELVTQSYRRSFLAEKKIAVITARCGNVFGGGDWNRDRIVVDAMKAFASGQPLVVRNPASVRPWLHVFDSLRGYLLAIESAWNNPSKFSRSWNFAPTGKGVKVDKLADLLCDAWGKSAAWKQQGKTAAVHEAKLLNLNAGEAKKLLKWTPAFSLQEGVELTVSWYWQFYQERPMPSDLYAISATQIRSAWNLPTVAAVKAA